MIVILSIIFHYMPSLHYIYYYYYHTYTHTLKHTHTKPHIDA